MHAVDAAEEAEKEHTSGKEDRSPAASATPACAQMIRPHCAASYRAKLQAERQLGNYYHLHSNSQKPRMKFNETEHTEIKMK